MANENNARPTAVVVDDDPFILMGACDILEEAGFDCHEAQTDDEAKELLAKHGAETTLLFSDVDMPGQTNGFALARHTAEHWPHIEIVIASGHVMAQPGDLPERATFLQKPFNAHAVKDHLRAKLPDDQKPEELKD